MPVGPPLRHLARRLLAILLGTLLSACASGPRSLAGEAGAQAPQAAFESYRALATANDWAAEWSLLSPTCQQSLLGAVGRPASVADYVQLRQTSASNNGPGMRQLLRSRVEAVQLLGPDRAQLTVAVGGSTYHPLLVRRARWELTIQGEAAATSGALARAGDAVTVASDGTITIRVQGDPASASTLRTIPRDRLEGFSIRSEWLIEDFGGLGPGAGVVQGSPLPAPAAPTGAPPAVAPSVPAYGAPPPVAPPEPIVGSGSPDG